MAIATSQEDETSDAPVVSSKHRGKSTASWQVELLEQDECLHCRDKMITETLLNDIINILKMATRGNKGY